MQDVTRQRKIFEKWDYASHNIFLNLRKKREGLFVSTYSLISKEKDCLSEHKGKASIDDEMNSQDK